MLRRSLSVFLFLMITWHMVLGQSSPTGKLFIIGGGKRPPEMIARLIDESGLQEGGYGVILPMSSSEPDSAIYYALRQFAGQGLENVIGMNIDSATVTTYQLDSLRQASMIYISGGSQTRFMSRIRGSQIANSIREAYQQGTIVAGTSAGAAVMSELMITGDERNYPEYRETIRHIEPDNIILTAGLGLIKQAIIDQHFVKRGRYSRLISVVIERPELLGVGIDESTAIIVNGTEVEVIGDSQVIVISSAPGNKRVINGKMGAKGMQLDVLLPGDTFHLD